MNPHRVKVLHGADGDGGALVVPHHLKLNLFPAKDILFDEDLGDVKSMTQSLVAGSVSISVPDRSSFDIKA